MGKIGLHFVLTAGFTLVPIKFSQPFQGPCVAGFPFSSSKGCACCASLQLYSAHSFMHSFQSMFVCSWGFVPIGVVFNDRLVTGLLNQQNM